jgi:hypothetical protein
MSRDNGADAPARQLLSNDERAALERFSDAAGEVFARGDLGKYPATARQIERFHELKRGPAPEEMLASALDGERRG